jgi:hypothetical protein
VHLNINYTQFLRESDVDALLTSQTDDDLYGRNQEFDSYAYALLSAKTKLRDKSSPTHDDDDDLDEFSDAMEDFDEFSDALDEVPTMHWKVGTRALIIERYSRKSTTWPSNEFDCVLPCYLLQRSSKPWPTQRKWQKQYSLFQCDVIFDRGFHF